MQRKEMDKPRWEMTPQDIVLMTVEGLAFIAQVVLCLFFYNSMGLDWLLVLGWAMLAAALVLGWRARVAFETHGQPRERKDWLHTTVVVNSGIYALVRHPMYLSFILVALALVLLCQHWLNALLGLLLAGLLYNDMRREERGNVDKFGDAYLDYMKQVPRANLVVGIIRLVRKKEL
jgi:protein-S-isoprenylcysteine O-methyltransferase Ste14